MGLNELACSCIMMGLFVYLIKEIPKNRETK